MYAWSGRIGRAEEAAPRYTAGRRSRRGLARESLAISDIRQPVRPLLASLSGWSGVFIALVVLAFALFTALPGTVEGKSLAVLHGLCAQQPTHSYYFGEARLPFDARMTGIYGGFAMTAGVLFLRGRWRAAGMQDIGVILALVVLVLPLAVDGTNSLLKDVEFPYLYEPRNILRTVTGLMLGTSLASFVWLLVNQTAFQPSPTSQAKVWKGLKELGLVLVGQMAVAAAIGFSDLQVRLPLTYLLMASAAAVVSGLLLPFVLLITRSEQRARSTYELARPATFSLLAALVFIAGMSGGRFLLEAMLGLPVATLA